MKLEFFLPRFEKKPASWRCEVLGARSVRRRLDSGLCLIPDLVDVCLVFLRSVSGEFLMSRLNLYRWIDGIFVSVFRPRPTYAAFSL